MAGQGFHYHLLSLSTVAFLIKGNLAETVRGSHRQLLPVQLTHVAWKHAQSEEFCQLQIANFVLEFQIRSMKLHISHSCCVKNCLLKYSALNTAVYIQATIPANPQFNSTISTTALTHHNPNPNSQELATPPRLLSPTRPFSQPQKGPNPQNNTCKPDIKASSYLPTIITTSNMHTTPHPSRHHHPILPSHKHLPHPTHIS